MQLSDTLPPLLCLLATAWAGWLWLGFRNSKIALLFLLLLAVTVAESFAIVQQTDRSLANEFSHVGVGLLCLLVMFLVEQMTVALEQATTLEQTAGEDFERLKSVTQATPAALYQKDTTRRFQFVNQHFLDLWHVTAEDVINISDAEIFPEQFAQADQLSDEATLNSGERQEHSEQVPLADGGVFHLRVIKEPLFDAAGHIVGLVGLHDDITDQKEIEAGHADSHNRTKKLDYALKALMPQVDASLHELLQATAAITTTASEALDVQRVGIWLFDDEQQDLSCIDQFDVTSESHVSELKFSITGCPAYFSAIKENMVFAVANASADARTTELSANYFSPQGIVSVLTATIRLSGIVRGVISLEQTGQRRQWHDEECTFAVALADQVSKVLLYDEYTSTLEQHLESEEKYLTLQQRSFDAVAVIQGWKLIDFNAQFEKLTGWKTAELMDQDFRELLHPDDRELLIQRYRMRRADQPVAEQYRTALIHKDGMRIDVNLKLGSVQLATGPAILIVVHEQSEPEPTSDQPSKTVQHPQK